MTQSYEEIRASVLAKFPTVPVISNYEMIVLLQKQFNHKENDTPSTDVKLLNAVFQLLREENKETNDEAAAKNFEKFRDGIGDQITIAHCIAFKFAALTDQPFDLLPDDQRPQNYTEYCNNVNAKLAVLDDVLVGKRVSNEGDITEQIILSTASNEEKQKAFSEYMTALHSLPLSSKINLREDLIEITLSSLSKICKTEEIAQKTLEAYQQKGYIVHIEESENGWVIKVSEDCIVGGQPIPKNKFLKALDWQESQLVSLDETPIW